MLLIPIELLVLALVALGTAGIALVTAKAHASWLPSWLKAAVFFAIPGAEVTVRFAKWLTNKYGAVYFSAEARVSKFFAQLAHYQYVVGYWSLLWPVALYHFGERLVRHEVPTAINARTAPLSTRIDNAEAQAKAAAGYAHSLPKVSKGQDKAQARAQPTTLPMPWASDWSWIHEHFDALKKAVTGVAAGAIAVPLPHAPAFPIPWRADLRGVRKRLKGLEYLLGATGAAVLVARAIGGITPRCVKSGAVGKVARALCGIPTHFLDDLLGLIVDFFILENVCKVLPFLETAVSEVAIPLVAGLTDVGAGLCHGSIGATKPLQGPVPVAPPYTYANPLAA